MPIKPHDPQDEPQQPDWWPIRPEHHAVEDAKEEDPQSIWSFHPTAEPSAGPITEPTEPTQPVPVVEPTHDAAIEPHGDFDSANAPEEPAQSSIPRTAVVWLVCAVLGVLAGMIIALFLKAWLPLFVPWWIPLSAGVLVLLFSMFYARSTTRMQSKQRPTARQLAVPYNPAYTDVRPKDIYRIRHVLGGDQSMPEGSEQRIHCVFRLHPHFAVAICWRRTLILLAYAALTAWLSLTTDFEKKVPAWIIVGILLVLGFRTYLRWLLWRDFFFVLTDQNIILARIHSPWFWWLKGRSPYLPVKAVNFVELDESRLGNAFDYGTLVIDGLSKLDVAYNRLKFVRRHDAIGKLVLAVVNANKAETA